MKKLKLEDFCRLFRDIPITSETLWQHVGSGARYEEIRPLYDDKRICALVGINPDTMLGWFGSPELFNLPAGVVIEKINRALEQLGMLDEDL